MRVESLTLKDFKSYQDADLDLSGVQLASVVGPNGAGKSSILEAIAFALTGARSMRNLDQFIRQGAEECRVALTFSTGGETYRLTRTRSSRGSGKSTVELARTEGGLWIAEGEGTRDTEARVRQILGVDEDTLLGTAIVSQGDAGSFFALRPAQRLEALGAILKLDEVFGPLEAHFKTTAAEAKADLETARRDVERLEEDVRRLGERERELGSAQVQVDLGTADLHRAEESLEAARAEASLAAAAGTALERARSQLREVAERRHELQDRLRELSLERERLEERTAARAELEAALAERSFLVDALAGAVRAREADQARESEERRLEQAVTTARAWLDEATEEYRQVQARRKRADEDLRLWEHTRDQSLAQVEDLHSRIEAITNAKRPVCDRCGQEVADDALARTLAGLSEELSAAEQERDHAQNVIEEQARPRVNAETAAVETAAALGRERRRELDAAEAGLAALPRSEYMENDHRRWEDRLRELDAIPARLAQIETLEERLATVRGEAESAATALKAPDLHQALTDAEQAVSEAQDEAGRAEAASIRVREAEVLLRSARDDLQQAERRAARLEGEITQLAPSRAALAETRAAAQRLEQDQADAELLRKAFSKWGVPALIVGNVLLALEREVNELLALYEGSLALRFESERETRDGARESLEILVYDGEAWRPFETFSGGERYRVASAMRLGLAQLLSHRSGARVSTLIVDEPEGLDAPGRAHLARILERMSESFGIVLILTHYADLQEAFPSQLQVSRGEDGLSRVEVVAA